MAVKWWKRFRKERTSWVRDTVKLYEGDYRYCNEVKYLKKYGADYFPYEWCNDKMIAKIKAGGFRANSNDEPFVIHDGKKLYMDLRAYSQLLLEQNPNSPHRYFTEKFKVTDGDIFVDVGGAEGLISLDVVEKAKKIYILECDKTWIRLLQKTFAKYNEKVEIINKYSSDHDDELNIKLDTLLRNETNPIFIKMDVEGMEDVVLSGAKEILSRNNTKVAICTYHKPGDDVKFQNFFKNMGYDTEFSSGYMAMVNDNCATDRFRKAVLRCWKN